MCREVPVFIEQFPKLLTMRRHLVMEKVEFPPELITFFRNMEQRSNPFGIAPAERQNGRLSWMSPRLGTAPMRVSLLRRVRCFLLVEDEECHVSIVRMCSRRPFPL